MLTERQISANLHATRLSLQMEQFVKTNIFDSFSLQTKLDWSNRRVCSRGGIYKDGPGINISMVNSFPNNLGISVYRFVEYPSYDANSVIGGFYSKNPYDKLNAIIAHEVAHAVQFFSYKKLNFRCTPHGPTFKNYYTILRQEFVNKSETLKDQLSLKNEYDSYYQELKVS